MVRILIDPVTRIEGHLKVEAVVDGGGVKEARCSGMPFRGFENILRGRDPRDAQRITQRICGVCPTAHAMASTLALDDAFGIPTKVPDNGRLLRNLIFGSNYIQSHVLHFDHLAALDYVDVTAAAGYTGPDSNLRQVASFIARGSLAPFFPRYEGDYRLPAEVNRAAVSHYVEALNKRREAQEMLAIFGGKMPHSMGIFPGGALCQVTVTKADCSSREFNAGASWCCAAGHPCIGCCHPQFPFKGTMFAQAFDHATTGQLLDENHVGASCTDCHANNRFSPTPTCDACHDPEDSITFPAKRPGPLVPIPRQ